VEVAGGVGGAPVGGTGPAGFGGVAGEYPDREMGGLGGPAVIGARHLGQLDGWVGLVGGQLTRRGGLLQVGQLGQVATQPEAVVGGFAADTEVVG